MRTPAQGSVAQATRIQSAHVPSVRIQRAWCLRGLSAGKQGSRSNSDICTGPAHISYHARARHAFKQRRKLAVGAGAAVTPQPTSPIRLVIYVILWYAFNVVFNIVNKTTLDVFPMPWFVSVWQLAASGLAIAILWWTGLQPRPKLPPGFLTALMPVAFFHTIGHVAACVSISTMAVSFTHIVKSSEPVFVVALSGPLLSAVHPISVWLSLAPIIVGCLLAASCEVSFSWAGLLAALASNVGMVMRGIYSTRCLSDFEGMDGINLFGLISLASLVYCVPAAIVLEGARWPAAMRAAGAALGGAWPLIELLLVGGLFYHLYNQLSYMVLNQGVSPVNFSLGNSLKRAAVVVTSVWYFHNPVSIMNWIGSGTAIIGTCLYSVTRLRAGDT